MRMLAATVVVLVLSVGVQARVWTTVYHCDEKTPLAPVDPNHPHVYADIMVGTKLVIVVSSDVGGANWWGCLQCAEDDRTTISLTGRGYDSQRYHYADSCLPAAGNSADVITFTDVGVWGIEFSTSILPSPGDWFVVDYRAERAGSYSLFLYDLNLDWIVPVETLCFVHVPSCDFNRDNIVDFEDFASLASCVYSMDSGVNGQDPAFDLNMDSFVDFGDFACFGEHWLERTGNNDSPVDPNQPVGL